MSDIYRSGGKTIPTCLERDTRRSEWEEETKDSGLDVDPERFKNADWYPLRESHAMPLAAEV
jgi:hypothetical protein